MTPNSKIRNLKIHKSLKQRFFAENDASSTGNQSTGNQGAQGNLNTGNQSTGTGTGNQSTGNQGTGTGNQGTQSTGNQGTQPRLFTQVEVDRINADERRKAQETNKVLVQKLEQIQSNANLTVQEKETLAAEIETLKSSFRTESETHKIEFGKLEAKLKTTTEELNKKATTWQGRYEQNLTEVAILNAASDFKAFSPAQIAAILRPMTKVVEKAGEDGRPTGEFEPQVTFTGRGQDGKDVVLKLSVRDAVKHMTEMPDLYGNLFRSESNSGIGMNSGMMGQGNSRLPDINTVTNLEDYKKNRDKYLKEAGKK